MPENKGKTAQLEPIAIRQPGGPAQMPPIDADAIGAAQIRQPELVRPLAVNHGVTARGAGALEHNLAFRRAANDAFVGQRRSFSCR